MRKFFFLFVAFFALIGTEAISQSIDYKASLPVDQTYKKGVLPNGMTYYIKSTSVVKDAASYYIIQNVGSILENEDQRGLAHFLEHMAFNGTEHFPGKGILNTLQKHGAVFGKDINAYTSFDETVYNLNNIPTKDGLVDTCLQVLFDWSHYLLLTDEEIDAERGVIKEEWRARQDGNARLSEISFPVIFNHSKYADRMPIGLMSVVEGFKYKALRDFYRDWYRTDLQAIAVIGDFDVDKMEKDIIAKFSKIPAVKNPLKRYTVDIPESKEMMYSLGTDPEVSTPSISFGIRHKKPLNTGTVADLKRSLLQNMALGMLSSRIAEKAKDPNTSFVRAGVGNGSWTKTMSVFNLNVSPKPNKHAEAFKEAFQEVMRAVKFGYTQSEIDRMITMFKSSYENQIAKKDDIDHSSIEDNIQNNFLDNEVITDITKEYEITKEIFNNITAEELQTTLKNLYTKDNRFLNVVGVKGQENLSKENAIAIIESVENDGTLEPYTETVSNKNLVSDLVINEGKIVKEIKDANVGATTFELSNGVKVRYKFVNKQKNTVALNAISYGGTSLLKDEDLPSASVATSLQQMSGLGDFTETDLNKILAGNTARVNASINEINEVISGSSNSKDVETMLQMIHLNFVKPRFDADAFKILKSNLNNNLEKRSKSINENMKDSLLVTLYGKNNPKKHIFDKAYIDAISFDKITSIYKDRFADASDFEFFIVGDVKEAELKPLLEKFIASIPTKNKKENYKDNQVDWLSNKIDKTVYLKMKDPKASINIVFKNNDIKYSRENVLFTNVLGDILQLRVTETVRESEGGAYSPRAGASFIREPKTSVYVSFSFECNPDMADKLAKIVTNEFEKIANGTINANDLNKTRVNFIKERQQYKDKNDYDMQLLSRYFRYNENMNDPKEFDDILNKMSEKDFQEIAKKILAGKRSYEIIIKPKINTLN
ncbi:M16 family metallopeptidase [Flavobacterium flavipallidum]|uniref:Insulinase family protein n=1 Tax=Flavobacterium flavipallidum TaxID=3139140 RepID=A0ABU9HNI5_9FLAO